MQYTSACLPDDAADAVLVGRMMRTQGPVPILIRGGTVLDVSKSAATCADLVERDDIATLKGMPICSVEALEDWAELLLSPIDLQVVKAAGVTFALSAVERVIEERARGDPDAANAFRERLELQIGGAIRAVVPGSPEASKLKALFLKEGLWSQYLEVAIGPDAEIFTKAPVLATVGWGADIGVRSDSAWNNPEPEVVLVVDSVGKVRGATLGNDVNLRDFEGRSALLLGKAKDNNASCAVGPFIRLFDERFGLDDVRRASISLTVQGADGFRLEGESPMSEISRDPEDLVRQTMSEHDYPDGFALFLGTLFAPTEDRDEQGSGFTHKIGDVVTISTPRLGALVNRVTTSRNAPPWRYGLRDLMRSLAERNLLVEAEETTE